MKKTSVLLFMSILFCVAFVFADQDFVPATADNIGDFYGFGPIEIIKLDPGVDNLVVADFNGDGLMDIAAANNQRARIEILLQRTESLPDESRVAVHARDFNVNELVASSRFEKRPLGVAQEIFSMAAGDLNSDGLIDIVYFGSGPAIYVVFQQPRESTSAVIQWSKPLRIRLDEAIRGRRGLICDDLNGDGLADIALAGSSDIYIIHQKPDGTLAEPVRYPTTANAFTILAGDIEANGMRDLVICAADMDKPIHTRHGLPGGILGPQREFAIEMPIPYTVRLADIDGDGQDEILAIEANSRRLNCYKLRHLPVLDSDDYPVIVYPLESGKEPAKRDMVIVDVDGDGLDDVVISDPASAELILYRQVAGQGLAMPQRFPSFADVTRIAAADINGKGSGGIFVLSVKEKAAGVSVYEDGRLTFPRLLELGGEPLAIALGDITGDSLPDFAFITKESNDTRFFGVINNASLRGSAVPDADMRLELSQLRANPDGLAIIDPDGDGLGDAIAFVQWESPLLIKNTGVFRALPGDQSQATLLRDATADSLGAISFVGESGRGVLLPQRNFARSLTLLNDRWTVTDQFNARSTDSRVTLAAGRDLDGDGREEVVIFDSQRGSLQILKAGEEGGYQFHREIRVGKWNVRKMFFASLSGDGKDNIVLFDGQKFAIVPVPGENDMTVRLERLFSYETLIKDGKYGHLALGDINSSGRVDLIALDSNGHIEILALDAENMPVPAMRFRLFEAKSHSDGMGSANTIEPREMVVADVSGDGAADLVALIHDRIIIYPQDR